MILYLIPFLIAYSLLAWRRLDWAVMFILVALPSYMIRFVVLGIPFTALETMILIAFTVWAIKNYQDIIVRIKFRINSKFKIPSNSAGRQNLKLIRYPFDYEIIALLIVSWIAIAVAGFSDAALGVWKAYFFEPILLYILIINVFGPKRDDETISLSVSADSHRSTEAPYRGVFMALAIGAFWISGLAIVERLTGWNAVEAFWPRVTGPFLYPNALGLYLGPIVLLLIGWLLDQFRISNFEFRMKNLSFYFLLLTILTSVLAIFFASSEGALVGILIAGFILGLFLFINKKPKFKWLLSGTITIIFGFVVFSSLFFLFVVPEYKYFNFSCSSLNYLSDKAMLKDMSGEIRKQQWRETLKMMKDDYRWLLGTGLSGYQATIKPYHQEGIFFNFSRDKDFRQKIVWWNEEYKAKHWQPVEIYMYPHNIMLNFWTELGIWGMLLFTWIIIKCCIIGLKAVFNRESNKFIIIGVLGAMVVIFVHGLVDVPYFKNDLSVMFWVFIALLSQLSLSGNKQTN
ncbi:O-antigen ligase family protein [bacterium]|nr:O-antigen ligase family protein [bacterium]